MILATGNPPSKSSKSFGRGRGPLHEARLPRTCGDPTSRDRLETQSIQAGCGSAAFTLVELILVMALLMIVLAVSAPSLQRFFRGRNLDSEARRIYSLTSYAQSRAVYEGIPMLVWFDARQRTYGLQAASSFLPDDPKAVHFALDRDLTMEVRNPQFVPGVMLAPFVDREIGNLPAIRFRPDGSIAETSPQSIVLVQGQDDAVAVGLNTNSVRYEILVGNPYAFRK